MKKQNPVLLLFPLDKARQFSNKFLFLGRFLSKIIFSLKYDLNKAEIDINPENYCLASFISAIIYGIMFVFVGAAFGVIIIREITMFTLFLISMYSTSTWRGVKWFRGAIMLEPKLCPIGVYMRERKFIAFGAKVFIMEDMGGCVRAITCNPVTRKMHYVTLRKKHLKVVQKKVCFDPTVLKMLVLDDHSWSSDQADEFLKGLKCN